MARKLLVSWVLLLGFGVAPAWAQRAQDATIADSDVHQVAFQNDHIRVLEVRASHGTKSPAHSHPPVLVVSIGSARVKLTAPDGTKQMLDLRPGMVVWLDAVEHSWELLAGELHVVAVEVKSAKAAKAATAK
jgi:quercetin dioxygenase-like cupin family protein